MRGAAEGSRPALDRKLGLDVFTGAGVVPPRFRVETRSSTSAWSFILRASSDTFFIRLSPHTHKRKRERKRERKR